ncbi:hypothetical protein GEMRC1_003158 [Eukaryota sp. GEM-RC1]
MDLYLPITLPLIVLVLVFLIVKALFRSKTVTDVVSIIGPVDSGKTAMFFRYVTGQFVPTQTSMTINEETCPIGSFIANPTKKHFKQVNLLDFPGHERLRSSLAAILPRSRSIVFVVDGSTIERTAKKSSSSVLRYFVQH